MIKSKKGIEGYWYILLLIGVFMFLSIFIPGFLKQKDSLSDNPLYGPAGLKEKYLVSLSEGVNAELGRMDLAARYALFNSLDSVALRFGRNIDDSCGNYLGFPIVYDEYIECSDSNRFDEIKQEFDYRFYRNMLITGSNIPFNFDYTVAQSDDYFRILGFSRDTIKIPLNPKNGINIDAQISASSLSFDLSTECHYAFDNMNYAFDENSRRRDDFTCKGKVCTGPCPGGVDLRPTPYFNQCHVAQCVDGRCSAIDTDEICNVGCFFKSLQMAYTYYGFYYDEVKSSNTEDITLLIRDMEDERVKLYADSIDRVPTAFSDVLVEGETFDHGNKYGTIPVIRRITDDNYDQLVRMSKDGLVVIRLRNTGNCPVRKELGENYCPSQHFVLVVGANDNFVILNDPWTPGRDPSTGRNVVVTREFIKTLWSGRYVQLNGESVGAMA